MGTVWANIVVLILIGVLHRANRTGGYGHSTLTYVLSQPKVGRVKGRALVAIKGKAPIATKNRAAWHPDVADYPTIGGLVLSLQGQWAIVPGS